MFSKTELLLTLKMTETLMDCHERELMNLEPYDAALTPSVKGLILRGMLCIKPYLTKSGKKIMGVFITDKGRSYLDNL